MKRALTMAVVVLSVAACSKPSSLVALSCKESNDYMLRSSLVDDNDQKYTETNFYLIDYETGQVKRSIDKEGAPLVARNRVAFGPDFIRWEMDPYSDSDGEVENLMSLDRATLEIEGTYRAEWRRKETGTLSSFIAHTVKGKCEKTDVPWEKLKPKQV